MYGSGLLLVPAILETAAGPGSVPVDAFPEASSCVTVTAYESMGDCVRRSSANGFLVSISDPEGHSHVFALTAGHVIDGCDWAEVTVRAPNLSSGFGRMDLAITPDSGTIRIPSDERLDMVAICLDSAIGRNPEASGIILAMAIRKEDLAASARVDEGDTLICLVRPIEPMLWGRIGDLECVAGVVMPGHPEDGTLYVDLYVGHGYSGSVMVGFDAGTAGDTAVAGMLVARYLEIEEIPGVDSDLWLLAEPGDQDVLFGQVIPSVAILDLLDRSADD